MFQGQDSRPVPALPDFFSHREKQSLKNNTAPHNVGLDHSSRIAALSARTSYASKMLREKVTKKIKGSQKL